MQEEIIIDGVDVTECPHRKKEVTFMNVIKCYNYGACEGVNCLYKQLKRLEQENEKLKGVTNEAIIEQEKLIKEINTLRQENKELKEENIKVKKEFNNLIAEIISDIEYTGEIACNGESPKEHLKKCQKALKALEEILESAKFAQCLPCGSGNLEDCLNCNDDITNNGQFCMEKRIHDIKTKCVEVLNHQEG